MGLVYQVLKFDLQIFSISIGFSFSAFYQVMNLLFGDSLGQKVFALLNTPDRFFFNLFNIWFKFVSVINYMCFIIIYIFL